MSIFSGMSISYYILLIDILVQEIDIFSLGNRHIYMSIRHTLCLFDITFQKSTCPMFFSTYFYVDSTYPICWFSIISCRFTCTYMLILHTKNVESTYELCRIDIFDMCNLHILSEIYLQYMYYQHITNVESTYKHVQSTWLVI